MKTSTEQQITALFAQAMRTALALIDEKAIHPTKVARSTSGAHRDQSKYNPWRASVWDGAAKKSIYIGAFPPSPRPKQHKPPTAKGAPSGTKAKLSLVKHAA